MPTNLLQCNGRLNGMCSFISSTTFTLPVTQKPLYCKREDSNHPLKDVNLLYEDAATDGTIL